MPRTPLLNRILDICRDSPAISRRHFLKTAAATLALPRVVRGAADRVVVVGAGLAGLTCAYRLNQAGVQVQMFDASNRAGGRCWSRRDATFGGQITEHGGELIDTRHFQIRRLAGELGLQLDDLKAAEAEGTEPLAYFEGQPYTVDESRRDLLPVVRRAREDTEEAGYPTLYNQYTPAGLELDNMSIRDWIEGNVEGGISSRAGQLLDLAYETEYGVETTDQSSLNLIYLLGFQHRGSTELFGQSDERFHVREGNDQIASRLASLLASQLKLDHQLKAIRRDTDGVYRLTFLAGNQTHEVSADRVVMAIPFSILRSSVDYSQAGFSSLKQTAILEQGMGNNTKLHAQFASRYWEGLGNNGEAFSDTGFQLTWEATRAQSGRPGVLVNYTGGQTAIQTTGPLAVLVQRFVRQLEPVLPGAVANFNGKAAVDYWPGNPLTRGSYSYWRVGQYTRFAGVEREVEGACHFAGEHTSIDFQGYLNGAVESGERAAGEIVSALA